MINLLEKDADFILEILREYAGEKKFTHEKTCELHDLANKSVNELDLADRDLEDEKSMEEMYIKICHDYENVMININKAIEILTIGSIQE